MNFGALKEDILIILKEQLPQNLYYHSLEHVLDVYDKSIHYANLEGVQEPELTLLASAALLHDIGFIKQLHNHEEAGCLISKELLPKYGYTETEISIICELIMATRIPQSPHSKLAKILCDADLDYLGRDDFWSIGNTLFRELLQLNSIKNEEEWNQLQVKFLEKHAYFTQYANESRAEKKALHLNKLREIVNNLN